MRVRFGEKYAYLYLSLRLLLRKIHLPHQRGARGVSHHQPWSQWRVSVPAFFHIDCINIVPFKKILSVCRVFLRIEKRSVLRHSQIRKYCPENRLFVEFLC